MFVGRLTAEAQRIAELRRDDHQSSQNPTRTLRDPHFSTAHFFLGRAYEGKGMYDQAVEAYMKAGAINQVPEQVMIEMREVYRKSGWKAYVKANLDRLMTSSGGASMPPYVVSSFYVRLGQNDEAIRWLERAYEERDFRMIMITVSFEFGSLRSDPRFRDLVRRVGLPE